MIEYGTPLITKYGTGSVGGTYVSEYKEIATDPETGCLQANHRHGRVISFDRSQRVHNYSVYQNNKPVGMHFKWKAQSIGSGLFLNEVTSYENTDHISTIEMSLFTNGNLREISTYGTTDNEIDLVEFNSRTGFISNQTHIDDDGIEVSSYYTKGRIIRIQTLDKTTKSGYCASYTNAQVLSICGHYRCRDGWHDKIQTSSEYRMGYHLTKLVGQETYKLLFMKGEQDVTEDIKRMVDDFTDIKPEEESMIQLAFGNQFKCIIPDLVRNELRNKTII